MRTYEDRMIHCEGCGIELTAEYGETPRVPCPECRSLTRGFSLMAGGGEIRIQGGDVSMIHTRPGLNSTAHADDQGRISLTVDGPSPKNEEDSLDICSRLIRVLNANGDSWTTPIVGQQDVDGHSINADGAELKMQVVRASNETKFWHELNKRGTASSERRASEVSTEMLAAIRKKSAKYPEAQRSELALVLDAGRTPSHTFQRVLDEFSTNHLLACQNCGFQQVWVVGPQDSIVYRLDR